MKKKIAVITGAASGIGLALTKACIHENMHVVMVDMNQSLLNQEADLLEDRVDRMACDVTSESDVQALAQHIYQHYSAIDLLINNAGISGPFKPIWEMHTSDVRQVFEVNVFGVLHCIQAFLPRMIEAQKPAHVINMASFYGLCSSSQMAPYTMSKHAIVALTESLYFDLKRQNAPIDVSVICPSFTNTQLLSNTPAESKSNLHHRIEYLMESGRPVEEVVADIMHGIKRKSFYILPDQEIKNDCEARMKAVIEQTMPHEHRLEKVFSVLMKR